MPQGRRLRERVAGQSAMNEVVAAQESVQPRGRIARLLGVNPLGSAAKLSYRAALGELIVGDVLDGLGQRWDVLHDVPLDGDISLEHLVMGPAGTFAVRTANYRDLDVVIDGDILLASGKAHDDIEICVEQAEAASRELSVAAGYQVAVQSLLVVVAPRRLVVRHEPSGVVLATSAELERILTRLPKVMSGEHVAHISDLADLETTWPDASARHADTQRLNRHFALVRAEVRSAWIVRGAWGVAGLAVAYGILWTLINQFVWNMVST